MDKSFAQQFLEVTGVTLAAALAALLGAVGGLAFADKPTPRQAILIVFTGIGAGAFGSQLLMAWLKLDPMVASAAAFFLAVCGLPLLGFFFGIANRWKRRSDVIADRAVDKVLPPTPPESGGEV